MSATALKLENFDCELSIVATTPGGATAPDPDRMAAFDEGYAAGWEDAETAKQAEMDQSENAMRARLQELSFTFHEARAHVMRAVHPLLDAIVEQVLPEILHRTLGQRLKAEIEDMARDSADADISLLVAPGHADAAATLLGDISSLPFDVSEDPSLAAGQIHMRLDRTEREIDLTTILTTLRDGLSALDTLNKETLAHG